MKKLIYIAMVLMMVFSVSCTKSDSKENNTVNTENTQKQNKTSKEVTSNTKDTSSGKNKDTSSDKNNDTVASKDSDANTEEEDKDTTEEDNTADEGVKVISSDASQVEKDGEESLLVTDKVVIDGMTEDILNNMSLEEKIGQLFIVSCESLDTSKGHCFEWRNVTKNMRSTLNKYHVGGIILYSRNVESIDQTQRMIADFQESSRVPLFISIEEEGGDMSPLANNLNMNMTQFPNMSVIGELNNKDYANHMGKTIGKEIKELGFNLDFAPVTDVNTGDENSKIGNRSFGSDPLIVSDMVSEVVNGIQSQNVAATIKNFPGEGSITEETQNGSVNIDNTLEQLRKINFVPFKEGIKAGADVIMVSHASISRVTEDMVPASLSSLVMRSILRTELGFDGVIITDALNKKAITDHYSSRAAALKVVKAGGDMLLTPENLKSAYNGLLNAVEDGSIKESQIDNMVRRILKLKLKRGIILSNTNLIERDNK
ncbi:glycoside hydrolase family 3 protein [Anaeromicropila herbilytica]|uniref:beta-N-acetylhexosaminidase n=1 Tax=Anaeromicropila herbilytica TaxID=2785025 RepID=A0A7R7EJT4_9FIRM|nr:glycoside hydrolase family 3 protein [Anaeromicropila herbilytica]BCN30005.1 hypothetical protein bsdtb5_13000 [Anaeromicropila herbilytica]